MAKLMQDPYPGFEMDYSKKFSEELDRVNALMDDLISKQPDCDAKDLTGSLLRFPRADGYAHYIVKQHKPLTLQHIPFLDSWTVEYATIRGLNISDVRKQVRGAADLKRMFAEIQCT